MATPPQPAPSSSGAPSVGDQAHAARLAVDTLREDLTQRSKKRVQDSGAHVAAREIVGGQMSPGDRIELSIGPETFFPVKFNGFAVGPVKMSTEIRQGETADGAYLRLRETLAAMFECEFAVESELFLTRLEDAVAIARVRREARTIE